MLVKYKTTLVLPSDVLSIFALASAEHAERVFLILPHLQRKMLGNVKLIAHLLRLRCLALVVKFASHAYSFMWQDAGGEDYLSLHRGAHLHRFCRGSVNQGNAYNAYLVRCGSLHGI